MIKKSYSTKYEEHYTAKFSDMVTLRQEIFSHLRLHYSKFNNKPMEIVIEPKDARKKFLVYILFDGNWITIKTHHAHTGYMEIASFKYRPDVGHITSTSDVIVWQLEGIFDDE